MDDDGMIDVGNGMSRNGENSYSGGVYSENSTIGWHILKTVSIRWHILKILDQHNPHQSPIPQQLG